MAKNEAPPNRSFAESAARLNGIVQSVKAQQTGECRGTHCVTEYSVSNHSPDEVWAKNFATHGIGPEFDARQFQPSPLPLAEPTRTVQAPEREPAHRVSREPMAAALAKPLRERPSLWRVIMFGNRA
jgi:hypothetical protein